MNKDKIVRKRKNKRKTATPHFFYLKNKGGEEWSLWLILDRSEMKR